MTEIRPEILIISNLHDFATDHVVYHLNRVGISYLRLNRDQFRAMRIALSLLPRRLHGEGANLTFDVTPSSLRSIYFRAPVYLRDIYQPDLSPNEQLERSQWAAFVRGLTVFDNVFWMNHPQATYQAEIKPYQLCLAQKLGFDIPQTIVSNSTELGARLFEHHSGMVVKTLDPVVLKTKQKEFFIYSSRTTIEELLESDISSAPVLMQEALVPKIDIRVTVVRNRLFAVTIKQHGRGIDSDWRLQKNDLQYDLIDLPSEVEAKCKALTRALGLSFGAIDLVLCRNRYYFLEINPTGEWAWLVDNTQLGIDEEIATALVEGCE